MNACVSWPWLLYNPDHQRTALAIPTRRTHLSHGILSTFSFGRAMKSLPDPKALETLSGLLGDSRPQKLTFIVD